MARICRSDLIVAGDISMLPAGQDAAEAFYRITDAAYEPTLRRGDQQHPPRMDSIRSCRRPSPPSTTGVLHHAHLVLTKGDSHRLAEALIGKGVIPLAT